LNFYQVRLVDFLVGDAFQRRLEIFMAGNLSRKISMVLYFCTGEQEEENWPLWPCESKWENYVEMSISRV
jgi:hypothetical protein